MSLPEDFVCPESAGVPSFRGQQGLCSPGALRRCRAVSVDFPAHQGRLLVGVGGAKGGHDGVEQVVLHNALDSYFRDLFTAAL
jgi:hypothetical protein